MAEVLHRRNIAGQRMASKAVAALPSACPILAWKSTPNPARSAPDVSTEASAWPPAIYGSGDAAVTPLANRPARTPS